MKLKNCCFVVLLTPVVLFVLLSVSYKINSRPKLIGLEKESQTTVSNLLGHDTPVEDIYEFPHPNEGGSTYAIVITPVSVEKESERIDIPGRIILSVLSSDRKILYVAGFEHSSPPSRSGSERVFDCQITLTAIDHEKFSPTGTYQHQFRADNPYEPFYFDFNHLGCPCVIVPGDREIPKAIAFDENLEMLFTQELPQLPENSDGVRSLRSVFCFSVEDGDSWLVFGGNQYSDDLNSEYPLKWNSLNNEIYRYFSPDDREIMKKPYESANLVSLGNHSRSPKAYRNHQDFWHLFYLSGKHSHGEKYTLSLEYTNVRSCFPAPRTSPLNWDIVHVKGTLNQEIALLEWPRGDTGIQAATFRADGSGVITVHRDGKIRYYRFKDR